MPTTPPPLAGFAAVAVPPPPLVTLDAIDKRILALLTKDARISQRRLSRELGMSAPAVGERIARLERAGVIRGYTVTIDWAALGYVNCYLAVTVSQGADQAKVMAALHELPEVEELLVITGSLDMLARLRVRDHGHLRRLLLENVWQIDGLQRTETFLSLAEMPPKQLASTLLDVEEDGEPASGQPTRRQAR